MDMLYIVLVLVKFLTFKLVYVHLNEVYIRH